MQRPQLADSVEKLIGKAAHLSQTCVLLSVLALKFGRRVRFLSSFHPIFSAAGATCRQRVVEDRPAWPTGADSARQRPGLILADATQPAHPQAIQFEDALEMGEEHLDLLPLTPGLLVCPSPGCAGPPPGRSRGYCARFCGQEYSGSSGVSSNMPSSHVGWQGK